MDGNSSGDLFEIATWSLYGGAGKLSRKRNDSAKLRSQPALREDLDLPELMLYRFS